jgi:hypothetical protein
MILFLDTFNSKRDESMCNVLKTMEYRCCAMLSERFPHPLSRVQEVSSARSQFVHDRHYDTLYPYVWFVDKQETPESWRAIAYEREWGTVMGYVDSFWPGHAYWISNRAWNCHCSVTLWTNMLLCCRMLMFSMHLTSSILLCKWWNGLFNIHSLKTSKFRIRLVIAKFEMGNLSSNKWETPFHPWRMEVLKRMGENFRDERPKAPPHTHKNIYSTYVIRNGRLDRTSIVQPSKTRLSMNGEQSGKTYSLRAFIWLKPFSFIKTSCEPDQRIRNAIIM